MRKLKLYIDTSILNFALSDQVPNYQQATLTLMNAIKAGVYDAFISEVVLREINAADEKKAIQLKKILNTLDLEQLEINEEIEKLAEKYIEEGLIPKKYINDALHIAIATYFELDAIATWNFEHMVKLKTKQGVKSVNILNGYKSVEIISPLEVS